MDWAYQWIWQNDGVGNFTASAVMFTFGGRWVWVRHIKPHFESHREQLRLLHEKVDSFSRTPQDPSS